jgi:hypothetical protein
LGDATGDALIRIESGADGWDSSSQMVEVALLGCLGENIVETINGEHKNKWVEGVLLM